MRYLGETSSEMINYHATVRFITGKRKEETMTVEEHWQDDEAAIQRRLDEWIMLLRDKNIEGVMSLYAPEVVTFDIVPPLRYLGAGALRKLWEEVFFVYQGPIGYELRDLSITVGDDVAFTHSLNRMSGTLSNGQKTGYWLRWTACFRKINGEWLIVHHQNSVPVDLEHGKAALDLTP
jgi:ketosteroid isomerase-like protein